jgi:glycine cleavage system transcriptional repressor
MSRFMVVSVGADRPGVMAALSGGLVELHCNLSDTQMAVLQGYASVMIVTDAPATLQADELQAALERGTEGLGQTLWVYHLSELSATVGPGRRWSVSIHGADRPGVVYEITRLLADVNINIIDLQTRLSGPVGSLSMQVDVPASVDADEVASRVDRLADQLGMSCSIRPAAN